MCNLNPLAVAIIFISSSLSLVNAAPNLSINGDTATYQDGSSTTPLVQDANPSSSPQVNKMVLKNVQVNATTTSGLSWASAVSFGGVNGPVADFQYGNLSLSVDKDSIITLTPTIPLASALYSRTDSANATNTINNAGTINVNSSGYTTGIAIGILSENKSDTTGTGTGKAVANLQAGSNITVSGDNILVGIGTEGRNAEVTTDKDSHITLNGTLTNDSMKGISATSINAGDVSGSTGTKVANNGTITITNNTTNANNKWGILAQSPHHSTEVTNTGKITINGKNGIAIEATGPTGSLNTQGDIEVDGANAKGVILTATDATTSTEQKITASGNITLKDGTTPGSSISSTGGQAIRLNNGTQGQGTIEYNDATGIINVEIGAIGQGSNVSTGFLVNSNNGGDTLIDIKNIDQINITAQNSSGVSAVSSGGTGDTIVNFNKGKMNITGDNADGIIVTNSNNGGNINVTQVGDIKITALNTTPTLSPNEAIYTSKLATAGDITITSKGNIDITSNYTNAINGTGTSNGSTHITFDGTPTSATAPKKHLIVNSISGSISAKPLRGIVAVGAGAGNASQIDVISANTVKVTGPNNTTAVSASGTNDADAIVNIKDTDSIIASSDTGIAKAINAVTTGTGSVQITIDNAGLATGNTALIKASSNSTGSGTDAIYSQTDTGSNSVNVDSFTVVQGGSAGVHMLNNAGAQTLLNNGVIKSDNDQAIFSNNATGTTLIHNNNLVTGYVNVTGLNTTFNNNQQLELQNFNGGTKQTINNSFTDNNSTFNNLGFINFSDKNNDGTLTHAAFNNLNTFNQSGIIDLTNGQHNIAGNTLTIQNGGTGNFIANGGTIHLNTNISYGGETDKLIVDNVTTGTAGATSIYITPTPNSHYGYLGADGIEVVQVNGTSSANAFRLGSPIMNGIYSYGLFRGSSTSAGSWYLRNYGLNPVVGGYLANQTAATEMFNQQLRDRLLAMPTEAQQDTSQLNHLWIRTKMSHGSRNSVQNSINNRDRLYMVQLGSDIGVWQVNGGNLHLGLMAGYGDYKNTSTDRTNRTKADSTVNGYNAGMYASWFQNEDANQGLYIDTWSQYGWFRNETNGKNVSGSKKYSSNVWSNSIETGYGLALGTTDNLQWIATPQAQLTYHYYQADNFHDKTNNLYVKNSQGNGLTSRLGVRLQAKDIQQKQPLEPFVEVNWINSNAKNNIEFNGLELSDGMPHNRYQAKIGLQGNITNKLSVSAQAVGLWGDNKYREYQGQLNINYKF